MKRILILATILFLYGVASAQQQPTIMNADNPNGIGLVKAPPDAAIKMPAEYSAKIAEIIKVSREYAEANAKLVSAWKDYTAQQTAFQNELERQITRAALASHLTLEQLDNSMLTDDGKGNYSWIPKPKPQAAEAAKTKTTP